MSTHPMEQLDRSPNSNPPTDVQTNPAIQSPAPVPTLQSAAATHPSAQLNSSDQTPFVASSDQDSSSTTRLQTSAEPHSSSQSLPWVTDQVRSIDMSHNHADPLAENSTGSICTAASSVAGSGHVPLSQQLSTTFASPDVHSSASTPPSFDKVVELISTGQTDRIPGIKQIPLKINEEPPSTATMDRPAKPWERTDACA